MQLWNDYNSPEKQKSWLNLYFKKKTDIGIANRLTIVQLVGRLNRPKYYSPRLICSFHICYYIGYTKYRLAPAKTRYLMSLYNKMVCHLDWTTTDKSIFLLFLKIKSVRMVYFNLIEKRHLFFWVIVLFSKYTWRNTKK